MRTGRSLTVCQSLLPGGGGVSALGGVCSRGVCSLGESAPGGGGGLLRAGVSQHALRQTTPPWTESQMPVKTLPWPKNIDRGRNSSCYIALCAKSVGNFTTVTDRQLFGLGNLWFYTFIKDLCLEKCYSIYLLKIIQQSIHKMWKNNIIS